jgi:hypothetical protein
VTSKLAKSKRAQELAAARHSAEERR